MHIYHLEMLNATFLFRKAVPVPLYEFLCFHHMWVPMFLHAFNLLFTFITLANQYLIHIMWYLSILICCPLNYWIRKTPYMLVNLLTSLFCWLSLHILHLYFYLFVFLSFHFLKVKVKDTQSCLTLCDPMDYRVHGILQARILEWVAFPFSKGSSQPRDGTQVSRIAGGFFTSWATREAPFCRSSSYRQIWNLWLLGLWSPGGGSAR